MDNEVSNTFYEVQAEKFYQKKVEVARGVIELGQILIETKEKMTRTEFLKWLDDSRVGFGEKTAYKYMKIGKELEDFSHREKIKELSLRVLYTLASAPDEVKEEVANSKDKEEAEKKIKEYERQLKEEREAKETVIKNNEELQRQLEREKSIKKVEYRTNEVEVPPNDYDELKYKASQYEEERKKNIELGKKIGEVQNEKTNIRYEYENKMKDIQHKYDEIKKSLEEMNLEEEKLYKYVRQDRDVGQFVGDVQVLLLDRLASFKFSAYLDDDITKYSVDMLAKLINQIRRWCNEMESMLEKYTEEFEEQENKDDSNIIEIENVEVS